MDKVKAKAREAKEKITGKDRDATTAAGGSVRSAQAKLKSEGFDPGPVDGRMGPRTASAVRAYQKAQGLQQSGRLDQATLDRLGIQAGSAMPRMPVEAAREAQRP
jgi:peptidoglycan hydrolase-like protein with peptidoglycan-binding domain